MAVWHGRSGPAVVVLALFIGCGSTFVAIRAGVSPPTSPSVQLANGPRRAEAGSVGAFLDGAAAPFVLAAAVALAAGALHTRIQRRAIHGDRDLKDIIDKFGVAQLHPRKGYRNFYPGQRGYSTNGVVYKRDPPPPRMALQKLTEQATAARYKSSEFYTVPQASLAYGDVKEVATYMTSPDAPMDVIVPAVLPPYHQPKLGVRLEKEPGEKRPPVEDEAYVQWISDAHSGLYDVACTVASKQSMSLDKDIICDRAVLMLLLQYLNETMSEMLRHKGMNGRRVDLVKVSKGPNGKGLVLERLFDKNKLVAEFRPYRGGWRRSEVSNNGTYMPAFQRLVSGDTHTTSMMVTGLTQIAGSHAGVGNKTYRFVEFKLGGLSFLTRVRSNFTEDGHNVEVKHKNWYYQDDITLLTTYQSMMLGKVDKLAMGMHRSGKMVQVVEVGLDDLVKKQPAIVEAVEKRFGRLVSLLEKVQNDIKGAGDGPFVLQWSAGKLQLGKYEKHVHEVQQEEMAMA